MFTSIFRSLVAGTLWILWSSSSLEAAQIIWQSSRAAHEDSSGQALDSNFIFELGIFTETFVPTLFNVSEWANNWQAADRVRYDATNRAFTSRIDILDNAAPFTQGERGYIWGYSTESNEWFLMSSPSWTWPSSASIGFPLEWTTLTATEVIVGTLPNNVGEPHLITENVGNQPLPSLTKPTWQSNVFTPSQLADNTISAWSADPDHDGHSNLLEYALGGNPLTFEKSLGLTATLQSDDEQSVYLDIRLARLPSRLASTQIELSTDLKLWDDAGDAIQEDGPEIQNVRLPWSTAQRQFVRIQVTEH